MEKLCWPLFSNISVRCSFARLVSEFQVHSEAGLGDWQDMNSEGFYGLGINVKVSVPIKYLRIHSSFRFSYIVGLFLLLPQHWDPLSEEFRFSQFFIFSPWASYFSHDFKQSPPWFWALLSNLICNSLSVSSSVFRSYHPMILFKVLYWNQMASWILLALEMACNVLFPLHSWNHHSFTSVHLSIYGLF